MDTIPNEMLQNILDHINDRNDKYELSLTSKGLNVNLSVVDCAHLKRKIKKSSTHKNIEPLLIYIKNMDKEDYKSVTGK